MRISSKLVHAFCAYTRILHRYNMGLPHNAKVYEPKLRVRCDSGGKSVMSSHMGGKTLSADNEVRGAPIVCKQ